MTENGQKMPKIDQNQAKISKNRAQKHEPKVEKTTNSDLPLKTKNMVSKVRIKVEIQLKIMCNAHISNQNI